MIIAVLFSLAIAGQSSAEPGGQDERPAACQTEWASEPCRLALFDRSLAALPLTSIEDEATSGAEIYRARELTPWGRPAPVVSFERRPNQPPTVVISGAGNERMSAPVTNDVWARVTAESAFADRDLVPRPRSGRNQDEIIVCADGSTVLIEFANASKASGDNRPVRRKTGHTCEAPPVMAYVERLGELAVKSLPACTALADSHRLGASYIVRQCLSLRGDTLTAADLMNSVEDLPTDDKTRQGWERWLHTAGEARLDWGGTVVVQRGAVSPGSHAPSLAAFLAERSASLTNLHIYRTLVGGENAVTGWITGRISYAVSEDDNAADMIASYRQVWTKENGVWELKSWTIEPFSVQAR